MKSGDPFFFFFSSLRLREDFESMGKHIISHPTSYDWPHVFILPFYKNMWSERTIT